MRIVFHGFNALPFHQDFDRALKVPAEVHYMPDQLAPEDEAVYAGADAVIGIRYDATLPRFSNLKLFQVPGAGYDQVDLAQLPPEAAVCNAYGHEGAIAEYVLAAMLADTVPFADADQRLRQGEWAYMAGRRESTHPELSQKTVGIVGFGHIGREIARRAKAFGMRIHVCNRSPVADSTLVDAAWLLSAAGEFWGSVDTVVLCVPLADETRGLVTAGALQALRPGATLINVARGPVVDERALYEALKSRRLRRAVIDTWYTYPTPEQPDTLPSTLPFHELDNVVMTPHMSGWSVGTIVRRQATFAENIRRSGAGEDLINIVRPAR